MQKSYDARRYDLANFDQHLCLKPPWLLWAGALYLSRAVTLSIINGVSSFSGGSSDTSGLLHGLFGTNTLIPSCIAFLVLCTLAVRSPSAGRVVRWIFAHGRMLLAAAALLDAGLTLAGVSLERAASGDERVAPALLAAVFDGYFLVYLLFSRRVRDAFSDFPAAEN
jgi:hypothetical protein